MAKGDREENDGGIESAENNHDTASELLPFVQEAINSSGTPDDLENAIERLGHQKGLNKQEVAAMFRDACASKLEIIAKNKTKLAGLEAQVPTEDERRLLRKELDKSMLARKELEVVIPVKDGLLKNVRMTPERAQEAEEYCKDPKRIAKYEDEIRDIKDKIGIIEGSLWQRMTKKGELAELKETLRLAVETENAIAAKLEAIESIMPEILLNLAKSKALDKAIENELIAKNAQLDQDDEKRRLLTNVCLSEARFSRRYDDYYAPLTDTKIRDQLKGTLEK
ncbi:MAG: hypothetical protein NTX72_00005 [Candidatus Uhrbacteria bacterium]|nr:hypothetical protein [Candidatus Uhrbacteria bacterium]